MGKLGKLGPIALLVACGGLGYQGWANTQIPHAVDAQAESIACDELDLCRGGEADWTELDVSAFVRTYRIEPGSGPVTIECRWSALLFGTVTCAADRERTPDAVKDTPQQRPHELRRGNKNR